MQLTENQLKVLIDQAAKVAEAAHRGQTRREGGDYFIAHVKAVADAVEAGTVVGIEHFTGEWDNSPWWNNTDCILIEGATGVVCYGEVQSLDTLRVGDSVGIGEYIASVKRVLKKGKERKDIPGHSTSMLHMELYPHGTFKASNGFEPCLKDPTPYLLEAVDAENIKQLQMESKIC